MGLGRCFTADTASGLCCMKGRDLGSHLSEGAGVASDPHLQVGHRLKAGIKGRGSGCPLPPQLQGGDGSRVAG